MTTTWEVPPRIAEAAALVRTRLPRELVEQALVRYDAGVPVITICADLALSRHTLKAWRLSSGLPQQPPGGAGQVRLPAGEVRRRIEILTETRSCAEAARQVGIDRFSMWEWARRNCPDLVVARGHQRDDQTRQGGPLLPVEPLALWLDEQLARGGVVEDMADAAGLSARRLNAVARREFASVSVHVADRLLTGNGWSLALVYGDEAVTAA